MTERHWSETVACGWLEQNGLRLLEGNYNTRFGEIDLIMTDGDNVVLVEVRQRTSSWFETPAETVNKQKGQRLQKAAAHYLQRTYWDNGALCRFDVIAIEGDRATCINLDQESILRPRKA